MASKKSLLIVDISALAFRSHFAFINRPLTRSDGMVTSALYGTANTLVGLIKKLNPTHIVCARDTGKKTFRHEIFKEYKANRPPCPPDLAPQLEMMGELCEAFSMVPVLKEGFEADDIIGTYAVQGHESDCEVYIMSGDKDFMQLIKPGIQMISQSKFGDIDIVGEKEVFAKMGVRPDQVIDFLSLMGDSADHIPGAPGVGKVTAAKLLGEHNDLDTLLKAVPDMKKSKLKENLSESNEQILMSKDLVIIDTNVEGLPKLDELVFKGYDMDKLKTFLERMEFPKILARLQSKPKPVKEEKTKRADITKFKVVNGSDEFTQLCEAIKTSENVWCYPHIEEGEVLGLSLSRKEGHAIYLPMDSMTISSYGKSDKEECLESLFNEFKGKLHGHDKKPWFHSELKNRFQFDSGDDSYLIASVLYPGKNVLDLSKLSEELENHTLYVFPKSGRKTLPFNEQDHASQSTYCCDRVLTAMRCELIVKKGITDNDLGKVVDLEMELLPVVARMESHGITLDTDKIEAYNKEAIIELEELQNTIHECAGEEFNVRSPQQLGDILFEKMKVQDIVGIKKVKKTKTGYSTNSTVLEKIKDLPIGKALLRFRHLSKLQSGYLESLPKEVSPMTNRIHTHYLQNGTATGRLSSHKPNLQNIPMKTDDGARIRESFIPSSSENTLISADYSQIELRVLAHFCRDEVLLETFRNDEDVHTATAAKVYGVTLEEITREQRSSAKAVNFGLLYGMGPRHLSQETGMSFAEAQKFIKQYFETFPSVQNFLNEQIEDARKLGYVTTLAGRKRFLPDLESNNGMLKNAAENMALNTPIQGSAADIIKWAMIRLHNRIENENLNLQILLQVHDELIFECPKVESDKMLAIIREEMESLNNLPCEFIVPLKVQALAGANWREIH
jgi:DNA polymerase I